MRNYVRRDLLHNPRRTLASLAGVTLGVGLLAGVLFFMDASGATLTERALAPVSLDMQRVLTSPLGAGIRLQEEVSAAAELGTGDRATVTLTVTNDGAEAANEVAVNDAPPSPLEYVPGTTTVDGRAIPDVDGESPLSHGLAGFGLNLGTVEPGRVVTIAYEAKAEQGVGDVAALPLGGTVSSRELLEPAPANAPPILTLEELQRRVAMIPGVAAADGLGFVDLARGSLAAGRTGLPEPVRVFAFTAAYQRHHPSIRIVAGGFEPGSALLSAEAAAALGTEPGDTIEMHLPGRATPLAVPVSGVLDLTEAQPLFASRRSTTLEQFLYVPDSIVIDPATFREEILPAFGRTRANLGSVIKRFPVRELDVLVDRSTLRADPGEALTQTTRIADALRRIAPGQDYLIDNVSNALRVARDDAAAGRRMFLFLGLPGVLMACVLAGYAGGVQAAAERRERAILRMRGAHRGHLRRIAAAKAFAFALAGSLLGITLGVGSVAAILGTDTLAAADPLNLARSALVAFAVGAVITGLALYLPARRSVAREISEERRELQTTDVPQWRRWSLDLVLLAAAGIAEVLAVRGGALDPPAGSVYSGVAISLSSNLFAAPLLAWIGGVLVGVRLLLALLQRLPSPPPMPTGPVVRAIRARSLRRRPWALATGMVGLGLIVAFGTNLAVFGATYDAAKVTDARFEVGADLRITPNVLSARPPTSSSAPELRVAGVPTVSPVMFGLENSVLIGPHNQGAKALGAIDPSTFARVAPLPDSVFVGRTGADTMAALAADPVALLVDAETADDLDIEAGDDVEVILALGTDQETRVGFRVAGLYERMPGFPEGVNVVANLSTYQEETGLRTVDFFLADVTGNGEAARDRAIAALGAGPGAANPLEIETPATALGRDQSSLTALNVNGLSELGSLFVLSMSAAVVAIFVFGLMLQRRREYVTLRALGAGIREVRALVLGEAVVVAAAGLATGLLVGTGVAVLLVGVLRALFVLEPAVTVPAGRLLVLASLVLATAAVSGFAATEVIRRLVPSEILREE